MTENQTETRPDIPVGQAIGGALGQAQSVLAGLLVDKVTQAGTDRETYLALQRLGVLGDAAATDRYVSDLVDWLDLDRRTAAGLADGLVAAGLVTAGQQTVRIADAGAQLRAKIAGSISAVTAPIYESLSSSDVETTVRTLRGLSTAARAAMASGRAARGEGS
jgi:DNA-binding MarR family transcriptional regulator